MGRYSKKSELTGSQSVLDAEKEARNARKILAIMGAGTTALVAKSLNRNYLGIELNPDYIKIAEERISLKTNKIQIKITNNQILTLWQM